MLILILDIRDILCEVTEDQERHSTLPCRMWYRSTDQHRSAQIGRFWYRCSNCRGLESHINEPKTSKPSLSMCDWTECENTTVQCVQLTSARVPPASFARPKCAIEVAMGERPPALKVWVSLKVFRFVQVICCHQPREPQELEVLV